jgi:hypothetical protein
MSKAHLLALFGLGCAANSLICWLAAINPQMASLTKAIYFGLFVLLIAGIALDDVIYPALKLSDRNYYGILAMLFVTATIGGGLVWLS